MRLRTVGVAAIATWLAFAGCTLLDGPQTGATRYVDSESGNDSWDGLTSDTAWASLDRVNAASEPGDVVLFRRSRVFRGQLIPVSGSPATGTRYGAYGTGSLPEIRGSVDLGDASEWVESGGGLWVASTSFATDVGNLIFNDASAFGMKRWSLGDCTSQGDYFYDRATGRLSLYSVENPGLHYVAIEAALRRHVIDQQGASWVTYEDLAVRFGAAHGFGGGSTHHITIRGCDISYIGGGDLDMDGSNVRFGNGIEFWGNAHDNLVEKNRIWEIYDTGLSNQNHTATVEQYNIVYRNNVIWNCGMSTFEYWNRPEASATWNIRFEHNTATGAGDGWGAPPQRPDEVGVHLLLPYSPATASDICVQNNILAGGNLAVFIKHGFQWQDSLSLDGNIYHPDSGDFVIVDDAGEVFGVSELDSWRAYSGQDTHSLASDPLLANPAGLDFSLSAASPAIDAAMPSEVSDDALGVARPRGPAPDIGAYEW